MNLLYWLITMLLLGSTLPVLIFAKLTSRPQLARRYGRLVLAWTTIYSSLLLMSSLSSHERTVAKKNFCGAYFDCHLSAQIQNITITKQIGSQIATGDYYIVTVVFHNSAQRATLKLAQPQAEIIDYYGNIYRRDLVAEQALTKLSPKADALTNITHPSASLSHVAAAAATPYSQYSQHSRYAHYANDDANDDANNAVSPRDARAVATAGDVTAGDVVDQYNVTASHITFSDAKRYSYAWPTSSYSKNESYIPAANPAGGFNAAASARYFDASADFQTTTNSLADNKLDPFINPLPPQTSSVRQLVFELPSDVVRPRLLITETAPWQSLLELFLIGDEDSLGHAKTYLRVSKLAAVIFEERF